MVGLADRHEDLPVGLRRGGLEPVLERHLEGRLDGARPVAREEDLLEPLRCDLDEPAGELDRGGIGEAEVRGVGHLGGLLGEGRIEPRVPVAVHVAPHAGRAVEVAGTVGVDEPRALAPLDQERVVILHLRERVPDVLAIPPEQVTRRRRGGAMMGR